MASKSASTAWGVQRIGAGTVQAAGITGAGSASFTITEPGAGPTKVSVSSVDYTPIGGGKHLNVTVTLVDDLGNPVAGATVSADLSYNNQVDSFSGTTDIAGQWTFGLKHIPTATYTTEVTSVSAAGLDWDGTTPTNSYTK